jgi:hypothetical protein
MLNARGERRGVALVDLEVWIALAPSSQKGKLTDAR